MNRILMNRVDDFRSFNPVFSKTYVLSFQFLNYDLEYHFWLTISAGGSNPVVFQTFFFSYFNSWILLKFLLLGLFHK